jgi:hypothetical protein
MPCQGRFPGRDLDTGLHEHLRHASLSVRQLAVPVVIDPQQRCRFVATGTVDGCRCVGRLSRETRPVRPTITHLGAADPGRGYAGLQGLLLEWKAKFRGSNRMRHRPDAGRQHPVAQINTQPFRSASLARGWPAHLRSHGTGRLQPTFLLISSGSCPWPSPWPVRPPACPGNESVA